MAEEPWLNLVPAPFLIGAFNSQRLVADWPVIYRHVYKPPVASTVESFSCRRCISPQTAHVSRNSFSVVFSGKNISLPLSFSSVCVCVCLYCVTLSQVALATPLLAKGDEFTGGCKLWLECMCWHQPPKVNSCLGKKQWLTDRQDIIMLSSTREFLEETSVLTSPWPTLYTLLLYHSKNNIKVCASTVVYLDKCGVSLVKKKKKNSSFRPNLHLKERVADLEFQSSSPKLKNLFYPSLVIMIHGKNSCIF